MKIRQSTFWIGLLGASLLAAGCEYDHHDLNHRPPPGLGSLAVDNETFNDISVFVDSARQEGIAREDKISYYDLVPGVYRVVLEERGGRGSFRDDIDILEGRNTVIEVFDTNGFDDDSPFHAAVFFD